MRVLLLGEYSGFHKNLQSGLKKLGCEVVLASYSDGWKGITGDIALGRMGGAAIDTLINQFCIEAFKRLPDLSGFDVVQVINPIVFPCNISGLFGSVFLNKILLNKIAEKNKKIYLVAAGNDAYYRSACERNLFRYSPLLDELKYDYSGVLRKNLGYDWSRSYLIDWNHEFARHVDGVIPIAYDYSLPYRDDVKVKLCETIPMPIDLDKIQYVGISSLDKVVFYHGLNRYGFKGTRFIEEAFNVFNKKYKSNASAIIGKSLPLVDYIKLIKEVSVVIDQTNSYSYGMNALYSMALGKIVFSGCELECQSEYGISPGIFLQNILPDSKNIMEKMELILTSKDNIRVLGEQSRQFVADHHADDKIAKKYLNLWSVN